MSTAADRPSLVLRDARIDDFEAIRAIYAHAVETGTASFETTAPDRDELLARRAKILEAGFPWLVAEAEGRILGYGYFGAYRPRPAYRFTVENSIYVAPDARGRGVGGALLGQLVARAEAMGLRQMIAVIGDSANAASIGLHAALGFTHAGRLVSVGWKHGRWLDSVLMQRPLGEGDGTAPIERAP